MFIERGWAGKNDIVHGKSYKISTLYKEFFCTDRLQKVVSVDIFITDDAIMSWLGAVHKLCHPLKGREDLPKCDVTP